MRLFFALARLKSTLGAKRSSAVLRSTGGGDVTESIQEMRAPRTNGLVIHWAARYDLLAWLLTRGAVSSVLMRCAP